MRSDLLPTRFDFSLEKEDDGSYLASGELGCGKDTDARSAIAIAIMASMIEFMREVRINGEAYSLEDILDGSVTFDPEPRRANRLEALASIDGLTYQQAYRFVSSLNLLDLRLIDGMWYADDQPDLIDRETYEELKDQIGKVEIIEGEYCLCWATDKPYLISRETYFAAEREGDLK